MKQRLPRMSAARPPLGNQHAQRTAPAGETLPQTGRVAVLLLCLLLTTSATRALDPAKRITQYGHDVWQIENGRPQNSVRDITQSNDG